MIIMAAEAARCRWMFHGITRTELAAGQVRLDLAGWSYTSGEERRQGAGPVARTDTPCLSRTVALTDHIEGRDAAELVAGHIGDPYVPVWQGKGWTVELGTGVRLWQMTS
jgi:hypothetical protein